MSNLIYSEEAKQLIKEQVENLPKIKEKEFDSISPITAKEKYGVSYVNPGVSVMTVDETFIASKVQNDKILHGDGYITPTSMVLPLYGDVVSTYTGNIVVRVNGVEIPPTMYFIEPLALGLHFKNLIVTKETHVILSSQYDYNYPSIKKRVLILPTSKDIPLEAIGEFAPVLFEQISVDHILRYNDNKKLAPLFEDCRDKTVYVMDYKIEKRGIYATVKYYTD